MKIGSAHWHHPEPDELFGERTHAWDLPIPKKRKSDYGGDNGVNPYYQNSDGSSKSEAEQQATYDTIAPQYDSSGNYVGTSPVSGSTPAPPPPPSKTELLENYREQKEKRERKDRAEEEGGEAPSLAESLAKADGWSGTEGVGREFRKLNEGMKETGSVTKALRHKKRRETNAAVNEIAKPAIDEMIAEVDPGSGRATRAEAREVRSLTSLRDSPKRQRGRDLLVGRMSREDWKDNEGKVGVTTGVANPWQGVTDKTPAAKRRRVTRQLVQNPNGAAPLFPSETQAKKDAEDFVPELLGADLTPVDIATLVPIVGWTGRGAKVGGLVGNMIRRGAPGAKDAAAAARAADGVLESTRAAARATKTGKRVKRYRDVMEKPVRPGGQMTRQQAARTARRSTWAGAAGLAIGSGQADDMVKGTLEANVGKAGKATGASLLSMFAGPVTMAANAAASAKGLANAGIGGLDGDWGEDKTAKEAVAPTVGMAKAFAEEAKEYFGTYWTGDADDIRDLTEKYGYVGPMTAGVMTGAAFKGVGGSLFRKTIGKIPTGRKIEGLATPRSINEVIKDFQDTGEASVINSRATGWKEGMVAATTKRFSKARNMLNHRKFEEALEPFEAEKKRMMEDGGVDYQDIDIGTIILYPLFKGFKDGKLTAERIRDLLAADTALDSGEADILRLAQFLPPDVWNKKTELGRHAAQMQKQLRKRIDPRLTKGIMAEDDVARALESLATVEQIQKGEVARGVRRPEDVDRIPQAPSVAARQRYSETESGKAEEALQKREAKVAAKVKHVADLESAADRVRELEGRAATLVGPARAGSQTAAKELDALNKELRLARKQKAKWNRMSHADRERMAKAARDAASATAAERARHDKLVSEVAEAGRLTEEETQAIRLEAGLRAPEDYQIVKIEPEPSTSPPQGSGLPPVTEFGYHVIGPDGEKAKVGSRADAEALVAREVERANAPKNTEAAIEALSERTREVDAEIAKHLERSRDAGRSRKQRRNDRRVAEVLTRQVRDMREEANSLRFEQTADFRATRFEEAKRLKGEEKKAAIIRALEKESLVEFNARFEALAEAHGIVRANYIPHRERPKARPDEVKVGQNIRAPREEERREGSALAAEGRVDRRVESVLRAVEELGEREKQRIIAAHAERNGMWEGNEQTGYQLYFTPEEFDALDSATRHKLMREYKFMREEIFRGADSDTWDRSFTKAELDKATREAMNPGERYALVKNGFARRIAREQTELNRLEKALTATGSWASRLTLGTSIGWLVTQPVAEMLTLMASHPNPMALARAWKVRKWMLENDEEAMEVLRFGSGTVLGTDVGNSARLRNYNAEVRAIQHMKHTPNGVLMDRLRHLEAFGDIDRWKGAAIRELGTLMEIERNLKGSVRTAKATWGSMDAIEKVADELAKRTPAERVKYLWSKQGLQDAEKLTTATRDALAAGEEIIRNVDRQQGNWVAMRPGEDNMSSLIFFYPFIRFSLKWTFQTFPADHPARYSTLLTLGAFNAEMVEEIMGDNPMFLTDLAAVPMFDEDGRIASLVPVGRLMFTGNPATDVLGGGDPLNSLAPQISIPLNFFKGQDSYGEPLASVGGKSFADPTSWPARVASVVDQALTLSPIYREAKRIPVGKELGLPGMDGWDGRAPQVGDDPDGLRATVRRVFGPLGDMVYGAIDKGPAGIPADSARAKALHQAMYQAYDAEQEALGSDGALAYSEAEKKAEERARRKYKSLYGDKPGDFDPGDPDRKLRYWKAQIAYAEERYDVFSPKTTKLKRDYMLAQQRFHKWMETDPDYVSFRKKKALREEAALRRDSAAYAMDVMAKQAGLSGASVSEEAVKRGYDLHHARKLARPALVTDMATGNKVIEGGPHDVENGYDEDYWRATVPRGARGWGNLGPVGNLAFEQTEWDGDVKVVKPGEEGVTYYDDAFDPPEFGGAGLSAAATEALAMNLDPRLAKAPPKRKMKQATKILVLKEKVAASRGGVPSKVPKQYRAAIQKWGTWLEKEMRKNGLVAPDDNYVHAGLPKSMSGPEYLAKIIQGESNWKPTAFHPRAAAAGLGQFIPGTRQALMDRTGTDAWSDDPEEQVRAVAELLSGSVQDFAGTMDHYNPGFPNSGDNPYEDGTWRYYFEQDVGKVKGGGKPNPKLKAQLQRAIATGKVMGLWQQPEAGPGPAYPLGTKAQEVGDTHKSRPLGNWMSDNAVDMITPENTPVLAMTDAVVTRVEERPRTPDAGTNSGSTIYLKNGNGQEFSYMHLNGVDVQEGDTVKKGQKIGLSGIAAGSPHLHLATSKAHPSKLLEHVGSGKAKTVDKLPGPWEGSREMVRQIVGAPKLRGDHKFIEGLGGQADETMHTGEGHNAEYGYAQDINSNPGHYENEGEPPYEQATMDAMVKNLRGMGVDVPDLALGQDWSGQVGSYDVNIISSSHGTGPHIHVDAIYRGGGGTPTGGGMSFMERAKANRYGTTASAASSGGGTTASSPGGASSAGAGQQPPGTGRHWDALQGFRVGTNPSQKVPLWGGGSSEPGSADLDLPFLAEEIAKGRKASKSKVPQAGTVSTSSDADKLGLPTFSRVTHTKRKKLRA